MANLIGYGAPTDETIGAIGDIYTNENTGVEYECVAIHEIKTDTIQHYYVWVRVNKNTPSIPGGSGGTYDGLPKPATAEVDQFIAVSAVDKNGKVTGTKAVDITFPEGGSGVGGGIIDVIELPTENIRTDVQYRLMKAYVMYGTYLYTEGFYTVRCVSTLPEAGEPLTNIDQDHVLMYYNCADGVAYGYIDDVLSAALSFPAGWYDAATLSEGMGTSYGGIITDVSDAKDDEVQRLLLTYDYYVYQNGEWVKMIFASEKPPKIDITWDGDMTGKTVIDASIADPAALDSYFVKVCDDAYTVDELKNGFYEITHVDGARNRVTFDDFSVDVDSFPGASLIDDTVIIVYDAGALSTALGAPEGYITNGIYAAWFAGTYVSRLTSGPRITKIDSKYLAVSTDEVQSMIDSAIGNAIGGSY